VLLLPPAELQPQQLLAVATGVAARAAGDGAAAAVAAPEQLLVAVAEGWLEEMAAERHSHLLHAKHAAACVVNLPVGLQPLE
jgi:hypothetical protein